MSRLPTTIRVAVGFALVAASLLFAARLLGYTPHQMQQTAAARMRLCRAVAPQLSLAAQNDDLFALRLTALNAVEQNPDLLSLSIQNDEGEVIWQTPRHADWWSQKAGDDHTTTHVQLPVFQGPQRWGVVQLRFSPAGPSGVLAFLRSPEVRMNAAAICAVFLISMLYLRYALRISPTSIPPGKLVGPRG